MTTKMEFRCLQRGGKETIAVLVAFGALLMSAGARADGPVIIVFDAPGAVIPTCCGGPVSGTIATSINPEGAIAGYYSDVNAVQHSFIRSRGGRFTTFDAPGAGTLAQQGTYAYNINAAGVVAGDFYDSNNVVHGFLRLADGAIAVFDVPGAGTAAAQGTYTCSVDCLDADGTLAGDYVDASGVGHGFVRSANGGITTFDIPGATNTYPANINAGGTVVGSYTDAGNAYHGFVRSKSGVITTFEAPNANISAYVGTLVACNNAADAIIGTYDDVNYVTHGYVRSPSGTFTSFDASAIGYFTNPQAINASGVITGWFSDINHGAINRGFVRLNDE